MDSQHFSVPPRWSAWLLVLPLVALTLWLLWIFHVALAQSPDERLAERALAALPESGVTNPVTAVLLNYRGYDTLLELAVLLAAFLGVWALGEAPRGFAPAGPALRGMIAAVVPLALTVGGYLLWVGGHAPGGAFQAGAVLAAGGVLLHLGGDPRAGLPAPDTQRALATLGVAVFTLVGVATLAFGRGFLTYPVAGAKGLILLIESAATLAIAVILVAVYVGGHPVERER